MRCIGYNLLSLLLLFFCFSTTAVGQTKSVYDFSIDTKTIELASLDERILHYQRNNNLKKLAKAYEQKADFLYTQNKAVSLIYYEKSLETYTKIHDKEGELKILQFISNEYIEISDRQNALKKMYVLLDIYENQDDSVKIAKTYSGIGSLYADMSENKQALNFMLKALDLCILLKKKNGEAALRNNMAGVYQKLGAIEDAFYNLRIAERLNRESGNDYWLNINYTTYSDVYSELNMMDSVRFYLFKSNEYIFQNGNLIDSIDYLRKTGIYYLNVDSVQNALSLFNQGILASRKLGSLKSEAIFIHWISELYERNGEMDLALSFLQIRHDLLDSLAEMDRGKQLEEYKVLYEVKTLMADLSNSKLNEYLAQNEATQSRNRVYWLLGIMCVIILFSVVIIYQFRKQAKSNKHLLEMNVKATDIEQTNTDKYAQSNLSDGKKEEILRLFVNLMVDEQVFTDQDIKLNVVAARLEVSRTYLSQVINETYSQNFTAYINSYRINLAKTYLLSEEYDKYSIQGIAEIVGFKSVSAFNTSFKKSIGLAPSYYRRNGKKVK